MTSFKDDRPAKPPFFPKLTLKRHKRPFRLIQTELLPESRNFLLASFEREEVQNDFGFETARSNEDFASKPENGDFIRAIKFRVNYSTKKSIT